MAWEDRNGNRYYYRKRREGGRVVSEYVGSGSLAELLAARDDIEQEERQEAQEAWKQEKARMDAIDNDLDDLGDYLKDLLAASLILAGYHQHKSEWRKRRHGKD